MKCGTCKNYLVHCYMSPQNRACPLYQEERR